MLFWHKIYHFLLDSCLTYKKSCYTVHVVNTATSWFNFFKKPAWQERVMLIWCTNLLDWRARERSSLPRIQLSTKQISAMLPNPILGDNHVRSYFCSTICTRGIRSVRRPACVRWTTLWTRISPLSNKGAIYTLIRLMCQVAKPDSLGSNSKGNVKRGTTQSTKVRLTKPDFFVFWFQKIEVNHPVRWNVVVNMLNA